MLHSTIISRSAIPTASYSPLGLLARFLFDGPDSGFPRLSFDSQSVRSGKRTGCCISSTAELRRRSLPAAEHGGVVWRRVRAEHVAFGLLPQTAMQRGFTAVCQLFAEGRLQHRRPEFGIDSVTIGNGKVPVTEEKVRVTPFSTLLRFAKQTPQPQPRRVLLVAPMSGHFATLLRETVRTMLAEHARCLHHRLAQRARRAALGRRFRLRRFQRPRHPMPGGDGTGLACRRGVPAGGRGARRGRADGAIRPSLSAAQHDPDGRTDRHADQADQGRRSGDGTPDRMVRGQSDQPRPGPAPRRLPPGLSRLPADRRVHGDEPRAPHPRLRPAIRKHRRGGRKGRSPPAPPSTRNISR